MEEKQQTDKEPIEFSMAVLCYRGEDEVLPLIRQLHGMMSYFTFSWEIILVANYWPDTVDRTPEILQNLSEELDKVRIISEPKQGHMGWDMKAGLDACRGKYIGVIDGDGQFPVESIMSCFAKIHSEDFDLVKTYRVVRSDGLWRNVVSLIYNILFQILFRSYRGYWDVNSKPKILKRRLYEKMQLNSTDWFFDAELILNALKLEAKIYEIPVRFNSLDTRPSFVKISTVWEFTKNLLCYRFTKGAP